MASPPPETALLALGTVFMAEMGDKSQVLAVVLASRFRRPWAVMAGLGAGLLLNHLLAAAAGALLAALLSPAVLRWAVGLGFFAAALWSLLEGWADRRAAPAPAASSRSVFLTTAATFFVVEFGDRTQLLVASMTAATGQPAAVVAGALAGILLAIAPAVFLADRLLRHLSSRLLRWGAALVFVAVGLWVLLS